MSMLGYGWKIRGIVFGTTLLCVGLFGIAGFLLDIAFNTKPKLVILAVILSFPVAQFTIRKILKMYMAKRDITKL